MEEQGDMLPDDSLSDTIMSDDAQEMSISYKVPDNALMYLAQLASWTFFLVMLGELAYGEMEKRKILDFWRSKNIFST